MCRGHTPYLEDKLKNLVKGSVSRGKVDVTLSVQTISGTDTQVVINHDLARSYLEALRDLAEDLQIKNDVSVSQMARFSDIFSVVRWRRTKRKCGRQSSRLHSRQSRILSICAGQRAKR